MCLDYTCLLEYQDLFCNSIVVSEQLFLNNKFCRIKRQNEFQYLSIKKRFTISKSVFHEQIDEL